MNHFKIATNVCLSLIITISLSSCNQNETPQTHPDDLLVPLFDMNDIQNAIEITTQQEINVTGIDLNNKVTNLESEQAPEESVSEIASQAILPNVNGYLAYYRKNATGTYEIWLANQVSDTKIKVWSGTSAVQSVALSGNTNWVVASIIDPAHSKYDIYLFDLSAKTLRKLSNSSDRDEIDVSMSADGSKIVFSQPTSSGISKIIICHYDYTARRCSLRSILNPKESQRQASITSNGYYLTLVRDLADGTNQVLLYDLTANTYTTVITLPEPLSDPSASDGGKIVMYLRDRTATLGKRIISIKNLDTQEIANLRSSPSLEHPHLTADGKYFAYGNQVGSYTRVFTEEIASRVRANVLGGYWDYKGAYWQKPTSASYCVNPVNVPDANLAEAIRSQTGISGPILCTDMLNLSWLYVGGASDLTGIEYAINLYGLSIYESNTANLSPLSGLTNLQMLEIGDATLSDISALASLTSLTRLYLTNSTISDVYPLANLVNLQELVLYNNSIGDISPLSSLVNLNYLGLGKNRISNISSLASLTNLSGLDLSNNMITNISPLTNLTSLYSLGLSDNLISNISPLASLTNLSGLYLSNNKISNISSLASLQNLYDLNLYGNSISNISSLAGLTNLSYVDLTYNSITNISALSGLTQLSYLRLSQNTIKDIQALVDNTDLGKYDALYLDGNCLDLSGPPDLTNINTLKSRDFYEFKYSPQKTLGCP